MIKDDFRCYFGLDSMFYLRLNLWIELFVERLGMFYGFGFINVLE